MRPQNVLKSRLNHLYLQNKYSAFKNGPTKVGKMWSQGRQPIPIQIVPAKHWHKFGVLVLALPNLYNFEHELSIPSTQPSSQKIAASWDAFHVEIALLGGIFMWHPFARNSHHREGFCDALVAEDDAAAVQMLKRSLEKSNGPGSTLDVPTKKGRLLITKRSNIVQNLPEIGFYKIDTIYIYIIYILYIYYI